jgi:hypothetical protein
MWYIHMTRKSERWYKKYLDKWEHLWWGGEGHHFVRTFPVFARKSF